MLDYGLSRKEQAELIGCWRSAMLSDMYIHCPIENANKHVPSGSLLHSY